jgi:HEAT repeat protein
VEVIEASAREDEDADVREEALAALVRLAPERALPALLRGLEDEDSSVRERVVALLSELGDPRAVPALLRALRDTDQDVAVAAGNAVESLVVGRAQPK